MGVTCIFYIKEISAKTEIMSAMENRIINIFGGKRTDHWSVVCKLYKSVIFPRVPRELIKNSGRGESMYLLSFSSKPKHVYSIIDEKLVMEADNSLVELINKIKNIWAFRQVAKIDGYSFEIGDYSVRYGNLNVGSNSKGLLVEVEHTKSNSVTESSDLLIELIDYLIPEELYKNFKIELRRPDNGYDYTTVGLSQSKEEDLLKDINNDISKTIVPNIKMEIDNSNDTLNTAITVHSSSNEMLNINSPYSNNQSSVIETPGSLGSTIISNIVNETNKYVNADSSTTVDSLATTSNNSSSLNTSLLNASSLNSSSLNTNINKNINTNTNSNTNPKNNSLNSTTKNTINNNTVTTIPTSNPTAAVASTTATATTKKSTISTNEKSTTLPNASTISTLSPIAPIRTVGTNPLSTPLASIGAIANLNSLALNAAANSLTTTDITNYDISVGNSNTLSPLSLAPTTNGVPASPFLFNPFSNPITAANAVTTNINPSLTIFNASGLPTTANKNSVTPIPTILNPNINSTGSATPLHTTSTGLSNVFSKTKQNSLLSTINKKKKESLIHAPLSSSQITEFIQSTDSLDSTHTLKANTILSGQGSRQFSIKNSNNSQRNRNSISSLQERKEIKEVKERAHYNFIFTSKHSADRKSVV